MYICNICGKELVGHLERHMSSVHDIGVTWYKCTIDSCISKFKEAGNLKIHMALVHDIDVTWYKCLIDSS